MLITERELRKIIKKHLFEANTGSYPEESYQDGHIDDMMLDKEGWTTDPNDRKKIKQWYLDMGLAHK